MFASSLHSFILYYMRLFLFSIGSVFWDLRVWSIQVNFRCFLYMSDQSHMNMRLPSSSWNLSIGATAEQPLSCHSTRGFFGFCNGSVILGCAATFIHLDFLLGGSLVCSSKLASKRPAKIYWACARRSRRLLCMWFVLRGRMQLLCYNSVGVRL